MRKRGHDEKRMKIMVIEVFDGGLYVNILDHIFALEVISLREAKPKTFDPIAIDDKTKKVYQPPTSILEAHFFSSVSGKTKAPYSWC